MANFIELTSNRSERPVTMNVEAIAWVSTREGSGKSLVTVIHFNAGHASDAISLTVKEDYDFVKKKITA